MEAKSAVYETGVRIAQFIHYPDSITSGSTLDSPVSTVDIAATMLDFADIEPEYEMDGVSWKDAAMGNVVQQNHLNNKRCIFFEDEKDRSVRCGCAKYLELYAQNKDESSTYKSGLKYGYSVDLGNLFDLCGGTSTYVTDPANNMEVTNYNLTRPDINIYNVLECHRTKTHFENEPDYSMCNLDPGMIPTQTPTKHPSYGGSTLAPTTEYASLVGSITSMTALYREVFTNGSFQLCMNN